MKPYKIMKESIFNTLNELEVQSTLEKSRMVDTLPENRMLAITKETGELLNMLLRLKNAKNMLEIGTSVGYSSIWCAEAMLEQVGKVITIEQNPSKIKRAKENFLKAEIQDAVEIKEGNALDILSKMNRIDKYKEYFDFVLIDADKENIIKYFDLILPMVSVGGIIVTDNMTYPEKYREHMKKFSNYWKENPDLNTITSNIGNGEEITIKVK